MTVALESPDQPQVIALIAALDAYQDSLYPAECRYALDLATLCQPHVLFAVARDASGAAVGCAALVLSGDGGELKRMYVAPAARGTGVADRLVTLLESEAAHRGCAVVRLETGPYQPAALAFYARRGYARCGPFAGYPDDPMSVFMEKALPAGTA